jgi:predicted dehydrogenase
MMTQLAVIGLGHWGPNYLRNFSQMDGCKVTACVDQDASRVAAFYKIYPSVNFYPSTEEMYTKEKPDAVVIATPTATHFKITSEALAHNCHVLVEKPLAMDEKECRGLMDLGEKGKRLLMVGHTFLYNDAVIWMKDYLSQGGCGEKIYYMHAVRTNLGPIRYDVNALMDLAPHDISIFLYLLGAKPVAVSASGAAFLNEAREDVTFMTIYFENGTLGHVHVSWLDPRKVRQVTVIGDKKMIVFDDIAVQEPIRIYDKGVRRSQEYSDFGEFKAIVYDGDVVIPKVQLGEPLKNQCREFLNYLQAGKIGRSGASFGLEVVRVLDAARESLKRKGQVVELND